MKPFKIIVFLCFTSIITAQTNIKKSFIEVTGTSKIEVIPDEIYIDFKIKERIENGKKYNIEFLENQFKNSLKQLQIPLKNLFISDVNAVISKTGWWTKEVLSIANYTIKIQGVNTLKNIFEIFKNHKISDINITKASHSKIIELRKKNRINAIKAAKNKTDYLLNAIGEKTGKPLEINEKSTLNQFSFAQGNSLNNYSLKHQITDPIKRFSLKKLP